MDKSLQAILYKRVERTLKSLEKNKFDARYAETSQDAVRMVAELLPQNALVSFGGSMTLKETSVMDTLHQLPIRLLDRNMPGLTPEQVKEIYRGAFSSDFYLCSTNAVTENGELYNIDGNSNRVAAMLYGPDRVIVVAGVNKIVVDLEEAEQRLKRVAAPANATRLSCATPCVQTGKCENCRTDSRICCNTVIMSQQRQPGRVTVILVGESLGY